MKICPVAGRSKWCGVDGVGCIHSREHSFNPAGCNNACRPYFDETGESVCCVETAQVFMYCPEAGNCSQHDCPHIHSHLHRDGCSGDKKCCPNCLPEEQRPGGELADKAGQRVRRIQMKSPGNDAG